MQLTDDLSTATSVPARITLATIGLRRILWRSPTRNSYWRWLLLLGSNLAAAALTFLMQVAVARLLGLREYGNYIYAISIAQALTSLSVGGLEAISLRFVAQYKSTGDYSSVNAFIRYGLRTIALRSAVSGCAVVTFTTLFAPRLDSSLSTCLYCAAMLIPVIAALPLLTNILVSLGDPFQVALANGSLALLIASASLTMAMLGSTCHPGIVIVFQTLASLGIVLLQLRAISKHLPEFTSTSGSLVEISTWRSAAADITVISALGILQNLGGTLVSGATLSTDQAALLATASRFAALTLYGNTAVNQLVSPRFSALYSAGDLPELQRLVRFAAWASMLFTLVVAVPLVVAGPFLLSLFGTGFANCYPLLLMLLGVSLINGAGGSTGSLMYMTGHQRSSALYYMQSTLSGFLLSVIFIPILGLYGVPLGLLVSSIIWNVSILTHIKHHTGLWSGAGPAAWGLTATEKSPQS